MFFLGDVFPRRKHFQLSTGEPFSIVWSCLFSIYFGIKYIVLVEPVAGSSVVISLGRSPGLNMNYLIKNLE